VLNEHGRLLYPRAVGLLEQAIEIERPMSTRKSATALMASWLLPTLSSSGSVGKSRRYAAIRWCSPRRMRRCYSSRWRWRRWPLRRGSCASAVPVFLQRARLKQIGNHPAR
jgi:hypothetical protein